MELNTKIIYLIAFLFELYAFLGKVIYGGIYWGKLKYWNNGNSAADHIWLVALLQWIFGIAGVVIPFISLIIVCMLIHSTRSSNCNLLHIQFPEDAKIKIGYKFDNFPSKEYFDERCSLPHKLFISFLVFDFISSVIFL